MVFEQLNSKIENLRSKPLPGINAHKELSPLNRPHFTKYSIPKTAKQAGVLLLIYPNQNRETQILLTLRANYNGTHSNQISFPGGKKESIDINLKETALRETYEEVGIHYSNISVIKQLSTIYIPPSNFSVEPYIGITHQQPIFQINNEVEQTIEMPLAHLLKNETLTTSFVNSIRNTNNKVPCFQYEDHIIWGATAMILNEFKEILKTL